MEQHYIDHITSKIPELVRCTKDTSSWYTQLMPHKLITIPMWEELNKKATSTDSLIREMYMACTATAKYPELIKSLKACGNDQAAKILEEGIKNTTPESIPSAVSSVGDSSFTDFTGFYIKIFVDLLLRNAPKPECTICCFNAFTVSPKHATDIAKIITKNSKISSVEWNQIMGKLLPNHIEQDVITVGSFGYKIQKTIDAWISVSKKEDRQFSKLIEVIEYFDHVYICEVLKEKSAELNAMK